MIPLKKIAIVSLIFVALGLLMFGCLGTGVENMMGNTGSSGSGNGAFETVGGPSSSMMNLKTTTQTNQQYLTKQGYITIKVPQNSLQTQFDDFKATLKTQSIELGDASYTEYSDRKQYTLTIKVTPDKFDQTIEMIKGVGTVKELTTNINDVTKQYTDLDIKITNRENELARLNELYNKSESITDILGVEKEITRVETELEILKQEKQSLVSNVEKSTIVITIYEDTPSTQQLSLSLDGLGAMFFGALAVGITLLVGGLGLFLPLVIVIMVLWVVYKAVSGKKKTKPREPEHSRIPPLE